MEREWVYDTEKERDDRRDELLDEIALLRKVISDSTEVPKTGTNALNRSNKEIMRLCRELEVANKTIDWLKNRYKHCC